MTTRTIRFPADLRARCQAQCDGLRITLSELVARCLRRDRDGVALCEYAQSATRIDSVPVSLNLPASLVDGLTGADIRAVIAWRLGGVAVPVVVVVDEGVEWIEVEVEK